MVECDFLIIGGGIAGASAAFELGRRAPNARVVLLEREDAPGYHATGRSAALFLETYGGAVVRALARCSRPFLEAPPAGFAATPLLAPRGVLHIARDDQREAAERLFAECRPHTGDLRLIDGRAVAALQPVLRPGYAVCGVHEPGAMDMDVDALLQGFLRGFKARGGTLLNAAEARTIERHDGNWRVVTTQGTVRAATIVNAAGAWADQVAERAGLAPLGLVAKRRTAITVDPPPGTDMREWPMTVDADEAFYFKPEAGRVLVSPCDETPMPPCDAQADEWDVAVAADHLQTATTLTVSHIAHRWAGLRSFLADKAPAVGPDPAAPDFLWLAGQGGFGIETAPAMGRLAAAAALGADLPPDLAEEGLAWAVFDPSRFRGVR